MRDQRRTRHCELPLSSTACNAARAIGMQSGQQRAGVYPPPFVDDGWVPSVLVDLRVRRVMLQKQQEVKAELERLYGTELAAASGSDPLLAKCDQMFSGVDMKIDQARITQALHELAARLETLQTTLSVVVEDVNVDGLQEEAAQLAQREREIHSELSTVQSRLRSLRETLGPLRASERLLKAQRELIHFQETFSAESADAGAGEGGEGPGASGGDAPAGAGAGEAPARSGAAGRRKRDQAATALEPAGTDDAPAPQRTAAEIEEERRERRRVREKQCRLQKKLEMEGQAGGAAAVAVKRRRTGASPPPPRTATSTESSEEGGDEAGDS